jgi:hypothetical protein
MVHHRVFELEEGITTTFLSDYNNNEGANLFYNDDFIHELACFIDTF